MSNSSDSKFVSVLKEITAGVEAADSLHTTTGANNTTGGGYYNFNSQPDHVDQAGGNMLMLAVGGIAFIGGAAYLTKKYVK